RVLLSFAYAPVRPRGSLRERVIVLPDEEGHVGAVEVDDGHHKILLDKPYATSEITRQTKQVKPSAGSPRELPPVAAALVKALPPATPKSVERAIAIVSSALPPPDADGDGIHDLDDACPERAGVASPDPIRNGCPVAAERVIVVPDEDGHVGGLEIDDG